MSVHMCVGVPSVGNRNREGWGLLVNERITTISMIKKTFFLRLQYFFGFEDRKYKGCCPNKPAYCAVCMVGELARGGFVAVAFGVGYS